MTNIKRNFSRNVLIRLGLLGAVVAVAIALNWKFIYNFYFGDQLTVTGMIINSGIALLFFLGITRIADNLLRYSREEAWLAKFVRHMEEGGLKPTEGIPPYSIVFQRYAAVMKISSQHAPVNHAALASMLVAAESTRTSFPKFISNILILTGVFGTIVSLSIALLGASDLLESADDLGNMNLVIHGMATALSTTMTAIICYLFYGYFYLKLTDAQTYLLSGVEQATTVYLMPVLNHDPEGLVHQVGQLVMALRETARTMQTSQIDFAQAGEQLRDVIAQLRDSALMVTRDVGKIRRHLREGFRLPEAAE